MQPAERLLLAHLSRLRDAPHLVVAYSGGLDSTVLLHAVAAVVEGERLRALHIDHGLSPNAGDWRQHCETFCAGAGIPLECRRVHVDGRGPGVEQAARRARYQVFEQVLAAGGLLLTAHHRDDQVETVLFRLLRGAGPRGMAGIPESRPLAAGVLLRPLLATARSELEAYARDHGLSWVEDESNQAEGFDRNYLRHRVLPEIADRWPDYRQRIARSADHCESAAAALAELADLDLAAVGERPEVIGHSLDLGSFAGLSRARQQNLLREWIAGRGRAVPGHAVIDEVLDVLIPARADAAPLVGWRGGEFRRFRERLHLLPPLPASCAPIAPEPVELISGRAILLANGSLLEWESGTGHDALRLQRGDELAVGYRRGGEYCRPVGRGGGAPLKKLFHEYRVEPWLRDRLPLVFRNGELAAVPGRFVCREHCCAEGERGIVFRWRPSEC